VMDVVQQRRGHMTATDNPSRETPHA